MPAWLFQIQMLGRENLTLLEVGVDTRASSHSGAHYSEYKQLFSEQGVIVTWAHTEFSISSKSAWNPFLWLDGAFQKDNYN